jgi:NAD(P)H dehydrogenase (quinone)
MSSHDPIGVTGATGAIGGAVARRLAASGVPQLLIVRDPDRAPRLRMPDGTPTPVRRAGFHDAGAMREALGGVSTLLLVSASESEDRLLQHFTAVDAAAAAGVQRVVYISFLGAAPDATFTLARQHWHTEERIKASGMRYTFLRDSLYLDLLPHFVGGDGILRGPAGDGRVGAVARSDIADVAVEVLIHDRHGRHDRHDRHDEHEPREHDGRTYDLTGPQALTLDDVADALTRFSGRRITYHAESVAEAYESRARYGAPDWEVEGWVTSYPAIAAGELDVLTDCVQELTGRAPTSLAALLAEHPAVLERLRALPE